MFYEGLVLETRGTKRPVEGTRLGDAMLQCPCLRAAGQVNQPLTLQTNSSKRPHFYERSKGAGRENLPRSLLEYYDQRRLQILLTKGNKRC
jgi:hypothetical protein